MITETLEHLCTKCQSKQIVENGRTKAGKQKYHCRACGAYGTLNPIVAYTPERKADILHAYQERSSLRSIERTFGMRQQTVAKWLKNKAEALPDLPPLAEATPDDVLELDELWSSVGSKKQTMDLASLVPSNLSDCGLLHW